MTNCSLLYIGAFLLCAMHRGCAELAGKLAALAPEYARIIQERPHFGVYALINNVACERCGMKARSLQKASSCLPENVDAKKPVCMGEEQYLLEYGDNAMDLLDCYINYLEVKLEQLYCLLKANEVDKTPGLSTTPATAEPARVLFVRTATVMLSTTSKSPAYRNKSASVITGKNSQNITAGFHQKDPGREVVDLLLPFGDGLGEVHWRKAAKRNQGGKQWNGKHKGPHRANFPRKENGKWARHTNHEVNSKHKKKYSERQVSKYGHVESAGHVTAIRGHRGGRPERTGDRNQYSSVRKRRNDSKQKRLPSETQGQGGRDRWKHVRDLVSEDYDNRLYQSATERRVENPWERYDHKKEQRESYVRDIYPRESKTSDNSRYSRGRGVSSGHENKPASENAEGLFRPLYKSRSRSHRGGRE